MTVFNLDDELERALVFDCQRRFYRGEIDYSFLSGKRLILVVTELLIGDDDKHALVASKVTFSFLFKPSMYRFVIVDSELVRRWLQFLRGW